MFRVLGGFVAAILVAAPALGHHGFGRFDLAVNIELDGTLTGLDFVNPHAYVYFDTTNESGEVVPMRCEMRAATVLRRSGWSPDMFVEGASIHITGSPHQDDPASCYAETLTLGGEPTVERYQQFTESGPDLSNRPYRLASGDVNLSGDWAQEQYLMAESPGGRGNLVPKSMVEGVESGEIPMSDVPGSGWGAAQVTYTEAGEAAAAAARAVPRNESATARCDITSILFDWVFDGPINRITQRGDAITIEYGRDLVRTVDMNLAEHPADMEPSRAGHSIGYWDGDTLVVDTAGFEPGILAGSVAHSEQLHVIERYTLDPDSLELRREYVAEDPLFFADQYLGADIVKPADAPFAVDVCRELTYVDYSQSAQD